MACLFRQNKLPYKLEKGGENLEVESRIGLQIFYGIVSNFRMKQKFAIHYCSHIRGTKSEFMCNLAEFFFSSHSRQNWMELMDLLQKNHESSWPIRRGQDMFWPCTCLPAAIFSGDFAAYWDQGCSFVARLCESFCSSMTNDFLRFLLLYEEIYRSCEDLRTTLTTQNWSFTLPCLKSHFILLEDSISLFGLGPPNLLSNFIEMSRRVRFTFPCEKEN